MYSMRFFYSWRFSVFILYEAEYYEVSIPCIKKIFWFFCRMKMKICKINSTWKARKYLQLIWSWVFSNSLSNTTLLLYYFFYMLFHNFSHNSNKINFIKHALWLLGHLKPYFLYYSHSHSATFLPILFIVLTHMLALISMPLTLSPFILTRFQLTLYSSSLFISSLLYVFHSKCDIRSRISYINSLSNIYIVKGVNVNNKKKGKAHIESLKLRAKLSKTKQGNVLSLFLPWISHDAESPAVNSCYISLFSDSMTEVYFPRIHIYRMFFHTIFMPSANKREWTGKV